MLFGRYVWSPKIYVGLVYYLLSGMLFLFMFGKKEHGGNCSKDMKNV